MSISLMTLGLMAGMSIDDSPRWFPKDKKETKADLEKAAIKKLSVKM